MLGRLYDKVDGALGQPIDAGEVFGVEESVSLVLAESPRSRQRVVFVLSDWRHP